MCIPILFGASCVRPQHRHGTTTAPPHHHHHCEQRLPLTFSRSTGDNRCHTRRGHIILHICLSMVVGSSGRLATIILMHTRLTNVGGAGAGGTTTRGSCVPKEGGGPRGGPHTPTCKETSCREHVCGKQNAAGGKV